MIDIVPLRRPAGIALGLLLSGLVLRFAGASRTQIGAAAADPQAYVTATGADEFVLVLATALGWILLCWITLGGILVLGSAAPGFIGWLFHLLARLLLPGTLRRFVSLALGVTLLTGTSVASAAPPSAAASISVTLDWPAPVAPSPDWPPAPNGEPSPVDPGSYAVRPGDCLWDIAEHRLAQARAPIDEAAVAAAVAELWQLNRSQIDDPNLIFPGQVLAISIPLP